MSILTGIALIVFAASATEGEEYTNSIGMRMIRIEPGTFPMGSLNPTSPQKLQGPKHLPNGDWDQEMGMGSSGGRYQCVDSMVAQRQEKSRIVLARS